MGAKTTELPPLLRRQALVQAERLCLMRQVRGRPLIGVVVGISGAQLRVLKWVLGIGRRPAAQALHRLRIGIAGERSSASPAARS